MTNSELRLSEIHLAPHTTARNAAVATSYFSAGSIIASIPCLSTCVLQSEKGKRCDACHVLETDQVTLRKCSGCASFWYCSETCQGSSWRSHHKKLCKSFNTFAASAEYQALTPHDQVDAILLSQILANPTQWNSHMGGDRAGTDTLQDPYATFLDLLQGPRSDAFNLPLCLPRVAPFTELSTLARELYSRFGNNNFVLHSHLNSYAHGIFPLASRLFNHCCVPNAACKYIIRPGKAVLMHVVALQDIREGDEITIPYLDPALPYQTRREALRVNYDFECRCRLCTFQGGIEPVERPHEPGTDGSRRMEAALRTFALGSDGETVQVPTVPGLFEETPTQLRPVFHESYLPALAELFSKTSHEGPFSDAIEAGLTLLALYVLVYPPNYPQTGMHALELAKTAWNLLCTATANLSETQTAAIEKQAKLFLRIATSILATLGPEGDEGGPLEEIGILSQVLSEKRP
ncbi:SET domain-containing protein [Cubamyces lactineus]|nr:SET domain-containing protein [Cubamyces lactineus]